MLRVTSIEAASRRHQQDQLQPQRCRSFSWCNNVAAWITSILDSFALVLFVVAASTCNFVSVEVVSSDEASTSNVLPSSLGLFCPNSDSSGEKDDMSLISAIFSAIAIFTTFLCSVIAWYTVFRTSRKNTRSKSPFNNSAQQQHQLLPSFISITTTTTSLRGNEKDPPSSTFFSIAKLWFLQSVLSAIAAVTCIPIFLVFNSSTCVDTSNSISTTTCHFGAGSYFTIISCICLIGVTIMTQCIHYPPIPPNIRDIQIPNNSNRRTNSNDTRGTGRSIPLEAEVEESCPPPSSALYGSLKSFGLNSSNDEEKVEEGMEVPYDNTVKSNLPMSYDPYNSGNILSDDNNGRTDVDSNNTLSVTNRNNNNFCLPVAGIVSAVLSGGGVHSTSTSSDDDAKEDEDIITVQGGDSSESSTNDSHSDDFTAKVTPSSLLYSTSMMIHDNDDDNFGDDEDPIIIFQNSDNGENDDKNSKINRGRSTNDATVKLSNTTTRNDDTNVDTANMQRGTDAIELPDISLLDTDTTTVQDETSASNFDLGSLEPSTIHVKDSFMTENEELDINGDESILDDPYVSPPPLPPPSIQDQNEILKEISMKPQENTLLSNMTQMPVTTKELESVQVVESKKKKLFEFPKPNRLLNMCRKPLHHQQFHGKHQQRGYRYLEDIEIDTLFQPIILSPPLEILTVRSTNHGIEKEKYASSSVKKLPHKLENHNQRSELERQRQGMQYKEWNSRNSRTMHAYSDEPEPYLEFSDEELSDDDKNNSGDDVLRSIERDVALHRLGHIDMSETFDAPKNNRSKTGASSSRRRRHNHSSNRSVASSKTNLSLLTVTIAEETSEDLHNDNDDDSLLNSSTVPLVRSRSDPNLATFYSTKKTNNQIYDEIHMTGIHHFRSAQIFPLSTGSSSSPNHRRNNRWNNQHHEYRSLENDSHKSSTSLISIQRRRQHQLWYTNQYIHPLSSARSVPNEKSHGSTNKSIVQRKTPLFRSERASLGIHYVTNDEPSTSSSSNSSGDGQNIMKHHDSVVLPSQKARMARFQRLQHQQQKHSLNPTASHTALKGTVLEPIEKSERIVDDETHDKHVLSRYHGKKDKNETTISTSPDESLDIDDGDDAKYRNGGVSDVDRDHKNGILAVSEGDHVIKYDHHRNSENPADISFDSYSTNSSGMNNENDSSYMIDLLDVQLAELNRPDGALIGPDEASL